MPYKAYLLSWFTEVNKGLIKANSNKERHMYMSTYKYWGVLSGWGYTNGRLEAADI